MPMSDVSTSLRSASSRMRARVSASVRPAGSSSGTRSRMASGTARSMSSATDSTSSAASIASISTGGGAEVAIGELPAHERRGYRRTKGSFVTIAGTGRPRTSTLDDVAVDGLGRQECERDRVAERGREVAARHHADLDVAARHRVALTRDLAPVDAQAP